jgi:hypothetical protein
MYKKYTSNVQETQLLLAFGVRFVCVWCGFCLRLNK